MNESLFNLLSADISLGYPFFAFEQQNLQNSEKQCDSRKFLNLLARYILELRGPHVFQREFNFFK